MLDTPCLFSSALSYDQDSNWAYMDMMFEMKVSKEKRLLEVEDEEDVRERKLSKFIKDVFISGASQTHLEGREEFYHYANESSPEHPFIDRVKMHEREYTRINHAAEERTTQGFLDLSLSFPAKVGMVEQTPITFPSLSDQYIDCFRSRFSLSMTNESNQSHGRDGSDTSLISYIGRDMSINCLIRCSRSDYCSIASVNRSFRSLIKSGNIYKMRREISKVEHWIYFSCHLLEWEAFDPYKRRWMTLPRMPSNECFMCSDKESLAVGTELLVFGKEVMDNIIYKYSILTNSWSFGRRMNAPRCLFGSASLGEKAILAGGCDTFGNIMSSAELYNSDDGTWEMLPDMNKPRKMCSAVFMDGKFYVIGGIGGSEMKPLNCAEEYNLDSRTWTEIPNMTPPRSDDRFNASEAPPLVAVVNNELYAADYVGMVVKKYDKGKKVWVVMGELPRRMASMNGWGLAFRACGDQLIVIGGPRSLGDGLIEINSWAPSEGPVRWSLLARIQSGNFVYNCTVMGC